VAEDEIDREVIPHEVIHIPSCEAPYVVKFRPGTPNSDASSSSPTRLFDKLRLSIQLQGYVKNYHDFDKFGVHSLSLLEGCFVEYIGMACFPALLAI
jgi:hypothetical protein